MARRSRSRSRAPVSASRSSAARRSPSSRSSPTCSTSRRAARSASRCRRSRAPGTNNYDGSVYGYFRDDKWNAKDFIANRVLPYANQQIGGAIGGPLIKDKAHFFAVVRARERAQHDPHVASAALPGSSWSFDTKLVQNSFLGRADWQLTPNDHLTARGVVLGLGQSLHAGRRHRASVAGGGALPQGDQRGRHLGQGVEPDQAAGSEAWLHPLRLAEPARGAVAAEHAELRVSQRHDLRPAPQLSAGVLPEHVQRALRPDDDRGPPRHEVRRRVPALARHRQWQLLSRGEYIFTSTPADLARRFPVDAWDDPSRWDVTGLDSIVQRFDQNFGDWTIDIPRPTWAVWFGDTWRMRERLHGELRRPLGCGLGRARSAAHHDAGDVQPGGRDGRIRDIALEPGAMLYPNNLRDIGSVAPRGGFTWNVGGRGDLVIRGGSGLYYSIPDSNTTFSIQSFNGERILVNSFPNDGRPGFIQDPTRGRTPEDFLSGRFPVPAQGPRVIAHDYQMPSTWQSILGMQKQIGSQLGVRSRLHALEGLSLRPPARSEPVLQSRDRLQPQPGAGPARSEVRADPVARIERQGRLRGDLDRVEPPLRQQLAGVVVLHLHVVHERQHQRLPVAGQQPVRSGSRVGAVDGLPAPHACGSTASGGCRTTSRCRARTCLAPATTIRRRSR